MIAASHQGAFRGPNRLWFEGPEPERSDGTIESAAATVRYTWSFRGAAQQGEMELAGPAGALRCKWKDTWHAADGMLLHGRLLDGAILLYGTFAAGDGPDYGWRIELDARDPEHFTIRMFNIEPGGAETIAVDLRGAR
jgi:hypothetical protein